MSARANHRELEAIFRTDFYAFVEKCFVHFHPGARFVRNWSHQAIAYQHELVFRGLCTRLILNAPPRSLKSLIASVAFPAWVIGKKPATQFICASYNQDLANKHSNDFRRIVQSQWYKNLFYPSTPIKDIESEYQTAQGGGRVATSTGGTLTGLGAHFIIVDDPSSAADALSKTSRERVIE